MWNERYGSDEYIYGTQPNVFLAENAKLLTGPVLSLAEGEGRNAVFLASLGLDVLGVDSSEVGLAKARTLAESRGVGIKTEVADLATYDPPENCFGAVISVFAHLPSEIRGRLYRLVEQSLKPGESFCWKRITNRSCLEILEAPKMQTCSWLDWIWRRRFQIAR